MLSCLFIPSIFSFPKMLISKRLFVAELFRFAYVVVHPEQDNVILYYLSVFQPSSDLKIVCIVTRRQQLLGKKKTFNLNSHSSVMEPCM